MASRARLVCATLCLLWTGVAVFRVALAVNGHPGDTASLALSVFSGLFGLVGFGAFALGSRKGQ